MPKQIELPRGRFGTVVADPPWSFKDKGSRAAPDFGGAWKYATMSLDAIKSLPVASVVKPSAHLYLWTTNAHLFEAREVMEAWGFDYKLNLVWKKLTATGKRFFGMGHYYRAEHELVLFGVRGSCPARVRNLRTVFEASVGAHSRKPEILQDMAEQVSPGPRLEMFATRARDGWTPWGDFKYRNKTRIGTRARSGSVKRAA